MYRLILIFCLSLSLLKLSSKVNFGPNVKANSLPDRDNGSPPKPRMVRCLGLADENSKYERI